MGNCIATNKVVSENDDKKQQLQPSPSTATKKISDAKQLEEEVGVNKRKMVTFKVSNDERKVGEEGSGNGGVRIRVVVTKEELRQILKHRKDLKCNSLEQLVSTLRLRERRRLHEAAASPSSNYIWKQTLESIPEDH